MNVKRMTALVATGALVAVPATVLTAGAAQAADGPERHARGTVGGARYDISVEKERSRFEIDTDLRSANRGSKWKVTVRHDGRLVGTDTARAVRDDGGYEVEFRDFHSRNTPGKDRFKVTIKKVGGPQVTRTITMR